MGHLVIQQVLSAKVTEVKGGHASQPPWHVYKQSGSTNEHGRWPKDKQPRSVKADPGGVGGKLSCRLPGMPAEPPLPPSKGTSECQVGKASGRRNCLRVSVERTAIYWRSLGASKQVKPVKERNEKERCQGATLSQRDLQTVGVRGRAAGRRVWEWTRGTRREAGFPEARGVRARQLPNSRILSTTPGTSWNNLLRALQG